MNTDKKIQHRKTRKYTKQ